MRVQTVCSIYIVRDEDGATTGRYRRGDVFDLDTSAARADITAGLLRSADADGPLPPPNWRSAPEFATQPDGTPLEDVPLASGATADSDVWVKPRTHAEADEQLAALNVTAPPKATVTEKVAVLEQLRAAQAANETAVPVTGEDLSSLSDAELIERGVDAGHSEQEMVELSHDELVLFVAEAVNRRSADPAQQAAAAASVTE